MKTTKGRFVQRKLNRLLVISVLLVSSIQLQAQKKFSLEVNVGVLQPVGKDITKLYKSDQPFTLEYFSKLKFDHPYISILPNLNYLVNANVLIGLQSGIYAHFNEQFSGYRLPVFVTVPLMATGRVNLLKKQSRQYGNSFGCREKLFSNAYLPRPDKERMDI